MKTHDYRPTGYAGSKHGCTCGEVFYYRSQFDAHKEYEEQNHHSVKAYKTAYGSQVYRCSCGDKDAEGDLEDMKEHREETAHQIMLKHRRLNNEPI